MTIHIYKLIYFFKIPSSLSKFKINSTLKSCHIIHKQQQHNNNNNNIANEKTWRLEKNSIYNNRGVCQIIYFQEVILFFLWS